MRAEVENPEGALRPGQFVRVRVALPAVENVIALPQTAVVTSLYGDYVYRRGGAKPPSRPRAKRRQQARSGGAEPRAARRREAPPPGVLAEPDGPQLVAKQVFVKIGRRQGNLIEIAEGLEAGPDGRDLGTEQARQQHAGHHQQQRRSGGGGARRRELTP